MNGLLLLILLPRLLLMSLAAGIASSSNKSEMGFKDQNDHDKTNDRSSEKDRNPGNHEEEEEEEEEDGHGGRLDREMSESSLCATDQEDDEDETDGGEGKIELGPQVSLKQQLEKDKDDESLRKWKEQLLGSVDINSIGETLEPEVKILSLGIKSAGRPDIFLPVPESGNPKGLWFSLKEGSLYTMKFTFQVTNNIVSGLKYTNTIWKTGVKVDSRKEMLGTFSPQQEPYTHEMPEETTPSGFFARGTYSARTKFVDDDNKCYLEMNYTFDIRKEW
ncbi:Rab GDP dissociation inhibitor alpha [Sarracenia purpurea var. burkii]